MPLRQVGFSEIVGVKRVFQVANLSFALGGSGTDRPPGLREAPGEVRVAESDDLNGLLWSEITPPESFRTPCIEGVVTPNPPGR